VIHAEYKCAISTGHLTSAVERDFLRSVEPNFVVVEAGRILAIQYIHWGDG
jgi:hypothetical protein